MGKEIGCSFKYTRSKISNPTLKKLVLSSSAYHTSYTTNPKRTIISYQLKNKEMTSIQNTSDITNTKYIHSCVTPRTQNINVHATSKTPRLISLVNTLPLVPVKLPKIAQLPPLGKEYLCFQVDNKSPHGDQCIKSRILNKAIDSILSINTFEEQCVVIKCMLQ